MLLVQALKTFACADCSLIIGDEKEIPQKTARLLHNEGYVEIKDKKELKRIEKAEKAAAKAAAKAQENTANTEEDKDTSPDWAG